MNHHGMELRIDRVKFLRDPLTKVPHQTHHFLPRTREGQTRPKMSNHAEEMISAPCELLACQLDRSPGVYRFRESGRELESLWHNSDYSRPPAIQICRAASHIGITSERTLPESV